MASDSPKKDRSIDSVKEPVESIQREPRAKRRPNLSKVDNTKLYDTFESGLVSSDWRREDSPRKRHSVNVVDDPTGQSKKVVRFEARRDDPRTSGSYRSELSADIEREGSELLYELSHYIPSDWKNDPAGEIIVQWHGAPDRSKGETWEGKGGPPLAVHVTVMKCISKQTGIPGMGKKRRFSGVGNIRKENGWIGKCGLNGRMLQMGIFRSGKITRKLLTAKGLILTMTTAVESI